MRQAETSLAFKKNKNLARRVEVKMCWRDAVLGIEQLSDAGVISVGSGPKATFQISHPSLSGTFALVCLSDEAVVNLAPWMQGFSGGQRVADQHIVLEQERDVEVTIGALKFIIRLVYAPRSDPHKPFYNFDRAYTNILAIVTILQVAFLLLLTLMPLPAPTNDELFKNPEVFREIIVKNEKRRIKKNEDLSGKKGARHKKEEGLFGKKDLPREDKLASKKGAPIVDKDKREEDRKIAMNALSKLGLTKEISRSSILGPGGVGSGLNKALGGLQGQSAGTAGGAGGLGTRGVGAGGGGQALGIGALGSGTGRGAGGAGDLDLGGKGKSRVRIDPGSVTYEGSLTREEIQRVVERFMTQIKYCYEREFQKVPDLEGKLLANWIISPEGMVDASNMMQNTMGNSVVEKCVLRVINRMVFPKPRGGGIVKVNYPFVFSSAGA